MLRTVFEVNLPLLNLVVAPFAAETRIFSRLCRPLTFCRGQSFVIAPPPHFSSRVAPDTDLQHLESATLLYVCFVICASARITLNSLASLIHIVDDVLPVKLVPRGSKRSTKRTTAIQFISARPATTAAAECLPQSESDRLWSSSPSAAKLYGLSDAAPADGLSTTTADAASVYGLSWPATAIAVQRHATSSATAIFPDWCCPTDALYPAAIPTASAAATTTASASDPSETPTNRLCGYGG